MRPNSETIQSAHAVEPRRPKKRRFGSLWHLARRKCHLLLPAAATVLILSNTYVLLGPVQNRSGDNMYHLMNEYAYAHAVIDGDNPLGPLGLEFGQPLARFYQILFYMVNVLLHLITGIHLTFAHNLSIVVCFALSPFAYCFFLRKLGLNRWAAALGSLASITSQAAFGNSFEAYHQAGIVTQSMGGLFFPWFMGCFIGLLRGENRASGTAVLFALAFLSHATMAVFAVFAGALYLAVTPIPVRAVWRKLTVFALVGSTLVAFWVLPFLAHTYEMRPIPDSIIRGRGVHWFTSVSKSELAMVVTTGRLLDDPSVRGAARDADDKLMDRISIIGTLKPRPPVITCTLGVSLVFVLFGLRRASRRYLLAGFVFSLMLFAGPDDFRWVRYLPFIKQIQTFRCTYLVEFFAFGIVGIGAERVLRFFWNFARRRKPFLAYPLFFVFFIAGGIAVGWCGNEIIGLGNTHIRIRDTSYFDAMVDACSTLPNRGFPFRISPIYKGRFKLRQAWFVMHGFQSFCTHWKGTGPTSAYHLCRSLGGIERNRDLHALAGIRYLSGQGDRIERMAQSTDSEGDPVFFHLPNGKDRRDQPNNWHYLLDTGRDHFLRPLVGPPLPVVCSHAQWIWLNSAWTSRYRTYLWDPNTPIPMRVRSGALASADLLESAKAVIYLDHSGLEEDLEALQRFTAKGGRVISPVEIDDLDAHILEIKESVWEALPFPLNQYRKGKAEKDHREVLDPGLEIADIKRHDPPTRRRQFFSFDVDLLESAILVLPFQAVPGWGATLNGKEVPVFPTGPDMVGIFLPQGAYRLTFHWDMPTWHFLTVVVSLVSLFTVIGVAIRNALRRRRRVRI